MKLHKLLPLVLLLAACGSHAAALSTGAIVLLQPEEVLKERGMSAKGMAIYLQAAGAAAATSLKDDTLSPAAGYVVFAVREGRRTNAWLDFTPKLPAQAEGRLLAAMRAIPAFPVQKGTVVFAMQLAVGGAQQRTESGPYPDTWRAAIARQKTPLEVEDLVRRVWP